LPILTILLHIFGFTPFPDPLFSDLRVDRIFRPGTLERLHHLVHGPVPEMALRIRGFRIPGTVPGENHVGKIKQGIPFRHRIVGRDIQARPGNCMVLTTLKLTIVPPAKNRIYLYLL